MLERAFPILSAGRVDGFPSAVPWWFVQAHEKQAMQNHDQTLDTLAGRGGLDWVELFYVVTDAPFPFGHSHDLKQHAEKVVALIQAANRSDLEE